MKPWIRSIVLVCVAPVLACGAASPAPHPDPHPAPAAPLARGPTRAIWVTRWDYRTRADVERAIERCADAGVNTVLFQVRGNATASYASQVEPWSEHFDFKDPGFDPLHVAIEAARARGIALHAWVNVMPAWWGTKPPSDARQVWNARPEWCWYDQRGKRQELCEKFYVSLNPCLPEVRAYLVEVVRDLVARYPVDGVHLDYVRFPNEPPATPKGSGSDWPRDARTVELYRAETGREPDQDRKAWSAWRAAQVTAVVRDLRAMLQRTRPRCELSAAVGPDPARALSEHFQDARAWIAQGLVDAVYPMNYAADLATFEKRAALWVDVPGDARVVMGVMAGGKDVAAHTAQLESSRRRFQGWSLFAYAKLWPSPADAMDPPTQEQSFQRDQLRKALVPLLREAAKPTRD